MNKEVKIGLMVILGLLIIFGVVVARRFGGSADDPDATVAENGKAEKPDGGGSAGGRRTNTPAANSISPTIVAAKPASGANAPLPITTGNVNPGLVPPGLTGNASDVYQRPALPNTQNAAPLPPYGTYVHDTLRPPTAPAPTVSDQPGWSRAGMAAAGTGSPAMPKVGGPAGSLPTQSGVNVLRSPPPYSALPSTKNPAGIAPAPTLPDPRGFTQAASPTPRPSVTTREQLAVRPVGVTPPGTFTGLPGASTAARRQSDQYVVQPNDSYWVISQRLYATGAYFKALAEHNRGRIPRENDLAVGAVISAPSIGELERSYPGLCPKPEHRAVLQQPATAVRPVSMHSGGRTYVVQEGDSLADIARHELGQLSRWPEIWKLNRDLIGNDYNYLRPGIQLILPGERYTAPVAGPTDLITTRPATPPTLHR